MPTDFLLMRNTRNQLLFSKNLTDKIIRSMQEGLIVFNVNDQIEATNEIAAKILGFGSEIDLVGKSIHTLFVRKEDAQSFLDQLQSTGHLQSQEDSFVKANGDQMIGLYSASVISEPEDNTTLKILILQDITDRKLAEQKLYDYSKKLERNNKELDQFAYIVSHDLKAPLRAISNLSLWLQEDLEGTLSDDSKKNFEMLRGRVTRLESLINGILDYSKIGRAEIASERLLMTEVITEILDLLSPPQHIKFEVSEDLPVLVAPKILLVQVFSNLISNAIKYNDKPQGLVRIYSQTNIEDYQFVVEDNGPGIAEEYHDKIFQIFQTLHARDKFESTGVGLTIVKRIIEEQGGKIWIESEVKKGCKFLFTWPKDASKGSK